MYKLELNDSTFLPHLSCSLELSLSPGEVHTIVGQNGVGKTTLIKKFFDKYSQQFKISLIEQTPLSIFYDRLVGDFKKIFLLACSGSIDEEYFHRLWQAFDLEEREDRMLSALSGGEAQALKLVIGLSKKADLFFLDEPSHALDDFKKKILRIWITDLMNQRKSVLIIEHDLLWLPSGIKVSSLWDFDSTLKWGDQWTI